MLRKFTLIMVFVLALSGCSRVMQQVVSEIKTQEPTVVISPGLKVQIKGIPTPIFGYDACPKEDPTMSVLFGSSMDNDSNACIVLGKSLESIQVRYKTTDGVKMESWKIVHGEVEKYGVKFPTTSLQYPDGSFVIAAE